MEHANGDSPRMTIQRARGVSRRIGWTTALVLTALGGAGLAVAADRPQNPIQRPELTWRADRTAAPWIETLSGGLASVDNDVMTLSERATEVLGSITALDLDKVDAALSTGDETSTRLEGAVGQLLGTRDAALADVDEWRLGAITRGVLDGLIAGCTAAERVPDYWRTLAGQARLTAGLVRTLRDHDDLVFQATQQGRDSRWAEALALLEQAQARLADATAAREELVAHGDVATLDDLLGRYRTYDAALTDLYDFIRDTGTLQGPEFDARQRQVEEAQAALPRQNTVLTVIVAEAAGPPIADALVNIEEARGDIVDALEAAESLINPTPPPSPGEPSPEQTEIPDPLESPVP